MTLVSSVNNIGSNTEFILGVGSLYVLLTVEALELILGNSMLQCTPVREKFCTV